MTEKKRAFIEFMLSADVLRFGEFKTKSGRLSPYFINTGNYITGAQINVLSEYYAVLINEVVGGDFDAMFGPAYKGIPLACTAASALYRLFSVDKPYFFNRKEQKDHGEGGNVVGYQPTDGDRIIIIEDVITAGTAVRESVPLLKACADCRITDMFISVDRREIGAEGKRTAVAEIYENYGIKVHSIVDVTDIKNYLTESGAAESAAAMEDYMSRYCVL